MDFFQIKTTSFPIQAEILFTIAGVPVTSTMMSGLLLTVTFILLAIAIYPKLNVNGVPGKLQTFLEMLYGALYDLVEKISGSPKVARQIMPIILAIVFYIGLSNTFMTLPVIGSLQYEGKSLFVSNTKDLNSTLGIAITAVLWTHILSIIKFNPVGHLFKFIKIDVVFNGFKKGIGAGLLSIIDLFIGILDIVSEFAKALSLSLRLFGNMFAGEILASLLMAAFALVLPVPIMFYGMFSGLVQAVIFGALVTSYFGGALADSETN